MNKTTKAILYGVGIFAASIVILSVARALIKGIPIGDGFKDWTNWLIAVVSGVWSGWEVSKKDNDKKDQ